MYALTTSSHTSEEQRSAGGDYGGEGDAEDDVCGHDEVDFGDGEAKDSS